MLFSILYTCAFVLIGIISGGLLGYYGGYKDTIQAFSGAFFGGAVLILAAAFTFHLVAGLTGGADQNYGHGTVVGTIIEAESVGTIYDTFEAKIRQGHGERTNTLSISGVDMEQYLGKRVKIEFNEYFLPDYKKGSSGKYITGVTELN